MLTVAECRPPRDPELKARVPDAHMVAGFPLLWRERPQWLEAIALLQDAVHGALWLDDLTLLAQARTYLALAHRRCGHAAEAEATARAAYVSADRADSRGYRGASLATLAWVAWREGELRDVERLVAEARRWWRDGALRHPFQAFLNLVWADALRTAERFDEASASLRFVAEQRSRTPSRDRASSVFAPDGSRRRFRPRSPQAVRGRLRLDQTLVVPSRCAFRHSARYSKPQWSTDSQGDGYFDQRQPVWHKEILWAIQQGAQLYGAASMGALRAAELAPYGMRGVGRIFELFRDGWLERDDEVAIAHSSAEAGYRAQSDALVNMRFTFRAAARAGVVPLAFAERCAELAEHTFYAERTYAKVLSSAAAADGCADFAEALRSWLEPSRGNRVDQKYSDAVELLAWLARAEPEARPARPSFHFSNTHAFQELVKSRMRQ